MKLLLPLVLVGVVLCLVLFIVALISPSRSYRWQAFSGRWFPEGRRQER